MNDTSVSIIMPVFNASHWLADTLTSIKAQSHKNWELIAVDDHSSDESFELLLEASRQDSRIKPFKATEKGIIPALQLALSHAQFDFISRMDADDLMPTEKLSMMLEKLESNPNSVVTGKVKYFSTDAISDGYQRYELWLNERVELNDHYDWIYRECPIAGANWMTHRKNIDFNHLEYPEDYALVFHWYKHQVPIVSINQITHEWRDHDHRTSKNSDNYAQEAFFDLKLNAFLDADYRSDKDILLMGKNKKVKLAERVLKKAGVKYQTFDLETMNILLEAIDPMVLVCVFPDETVRDGISQWFERIDLKHGSDWWWL